MSGEPTNKKHPPQDFDTSLSTRQIVAFHGVSRRTAQRWLDEAGTGGGVGRRAVLREERKCAQCGVKIYYLNKTDFCHKHSNLSRVRQRPEDYDPTKMTVKVAADHYGVGHMAVKRWRREMGLTRSRAPGINATPWSPEDEAKLIDLIGGHGIAHICKALGRKETSVRLKAKQLGHRIVNPNPKRGGGSSAPRYFMDGVRHVTTADLAAAHIRAHDRTCVYRCNEKGLQDARGSLWKYGFGSLRLTEDELLMKAERKGWSRSEWEKVSG